MRSAVMLVSMCLVLPWPGCPREEKQVTYRFVEVTGRKLDIFVDAVRVGQTGERIPRDRLGVNVALATQDNGDGTNTFSVIGDFVDAQVVFRENGKEVRITEEDWILRSSRTGRVVIKIRVVKDPD